METPVIWDAIALIMTALLWHIIYDSKKARTPRNDDATFCAQLTEVDKFEYTTSLRFCWVGNSQEN